LFSVPFWVDDLRGKSDQFRIGTVGDWPGFIVTVDENDAFWTRTRDSSLPAATATQRVWSSCTPLLRHLPLVAGRRRRR